MAMRFIDLTFLMNAQQGRGLTGIGRRSEKRAGFKAKRGKAWGACKRRGSLQIPLKWWEPKYPDGNQALREGGTARRRARAQERPRDTVVQPRCQMRSRAQRIDDKDVNRGRHIN